MIAQIYIDGNRLDLFEDENIELNSSIIDASDIQKSTTDFSREFTVPASARNNKYFKHYYDANIDNTFDARTKVKGAIELSGVPFKFGKFRLLKVNVRNNKPYSYTINFVGNLTDIKKTLGNDLLSDLDLTAFDHEFTGQEVKLRLGVSNLDLIYTLNPKRQYYYNSDPNDNTDADEITNIADNGASGTHGVRFSDLSPSLRPSKILEAISNKYGLIFSDDFFGSEEFKGLYQTITNSEKGIAGGSQIIDFDGGDTDNVSLASDTGSFYARATSASNDNIIWNLRLLIQPSTGYENVSYTLTTIVDDNDDGENTASGTNNFQKELSVNGERTFEVKYRITASEEFKYTANFTQIRFSSVPTEPSIQSFTTTASENTLSSVFITADNLPKIKVIDWLTGLFKACKLVIIPQEDGTFYVDTLNRYYQKGRIYDVTKYVDFESYDVARGDLFNEINFKFEEPETILNQQFEKNNGIAYGNEELKLEDADGEPLDGDTYDIEVPFETVVYDRLRDVNNNTLTPIMYAPFVDEDRKPSFPNTNFFYNVPVNISETPIRFITNNGVVETLTGYINTASHTDEFGSSNYAFLFGNEFSEWDGSPSTNNLYSLHHKDYIDSIFNVRRRNYKYKAVLPLQIASRLQLNDVIKIKTDYFRVSSYTTNVKTGVTTLNLINSFDNDLTRIIDNSDTIYYRSEGATRTVLTTTKQSRSNVRDLGYGTSWVRVVDEGVNLQVITSPNKTNAPRTAMLTIADVDKQKESTEILIYQRNGDVFVTLSSSDTITSDNNIITSDNG